MSAEDAKQFGRVSHANAAWVMHNLKCNCNPYEDVFTYNRWQAQGYQVRRGEHGIKLSIVKEVPHEERDGTTTTRKIFAGATVFCKCQVDKVGATTPTKTQTVAEYLATTPVAPLTIPKSPVLEDEPISSTLIEDAHCNYQNDRWHHAGYENKYQHEQAPVYHYVGRQNGISYDFHACEKCAARILAGDKLPAKTTPEDHLREQVSEARKRVADGKAIKGCWLDEHCNDHLDYEPTMTIAYNGREIASVNGNYKRGMVKEAVQLALAK